MLGSQDEEQREAQRAGFLRAEKHIWNTSDEEFAKLLTQLGDYPLVPYLIEKKILHNLTTKKQQQVRAFLEEYNGTPLKRRVLRPWLRYLAKKNRKRLFMEFYEPVADTKLACRYIRYRLEDEADSSELFADIAKLWNVGRSQPKDCDPIFKVWKNAGQLNPSLVLERIAKAARGGQHSLIPYLSKLLPEEQAYLGDLWHKTRRSPATVAKLSAFSGKHPHIETQILSYGFGRYIWRDEEKALGAWDRALEKFSFSTEQKAYVTNRFAIALAVSQHAKAEEWLVKSEAFEQDAEVLRWHLATLLKDKNWLSVIKLIEKSSPVLTVKNDYQYWLARSYESLGNQARANELYKQLANKRHYYGFLASARLEQAVSLENKPLLVNKAHVDKIRAMPSAQRAYELKQISRFHEARIEWRFAQKQLNEDEKLASAVLATEWEWHDQAIFTFSNTGYLDDIDRRFPMAYSDILTREAKRNKIEPEWAFAIARRESSFMTDAVSTAKAFGLMQVLPSTAKYLEKKRVSKRSLMNPNINAKLGNRYLRYLMDKVDNNTVLATASYNAGWRRVKEWLPEEETIEADLWVESIPFKETRNYVKAVLAYKQIYQHRLYEINQQTDNDSGTKPEAKSLASSVFGEFVQMHIPTSVAD
ncbi:transglycosylase SLT domain-containing protein [Glaciecola sp. MH2013]|nr:transglycosylase SLT domain-containing protein [Glaciecola sp. MH2013]